MIPTQPYMPWKVSMTVLHVVSILSTYLRIACRRKDRRLWWDDYAAIPPACINIINVVVLWLRLRYGQQPKQYRILYSYLSSFCFSSIIWWSRISLALAVVRITPVFSRARGVSLWMTGAFIIIWLSLLTTMITRCVTSTDWQKSPSTVLICGPGYWVTVASLSCDVIGDIFLVTIPLYQLWSINLPSEDRLRVRLVFSTSLFTLISAVGLCIFSYGGVAKGPGRLIVWLMVCHIEEAVSLIVCNLLVLVCWLHLHLKPKREDEVEDAYQPHARGEIIDAGGCLDTVDKILNDSHMTGSVSRPSCVCTTMSSSDPNHAVA
ncbi:hypothetical protein D9613_001226 [Agrocybe pediades]|uniref:Rhodopsin domain-containing protein n=1 Tax=Agrocybe pediades TaxID=84607 RepID=A0A8H4R296_9AGAR|nr:hypothetical protein D9613_001226 [Agrocybe pediades]